MKVNKIISSSNPDDPRPWADFEVSDGSLQVTFRTLNGITAYQEAAAKRRGTTLGVAQRDAFKRTEFSNAAGRMQTLSLATGPRLPGEKVFEGRPNLSDEEHMLAVTEDGEIEFVPFSRQRQVYYAHLASYDPLTGEWTLLSFVDE